MESSPNTRIRRKMRRQLYRIHTKAPKTQETITDYEELPNNVPLITEPAKSNLVGNLFGGPVKSNIFQNVVISPEALKQKLPEYSKKDKTNLEINHAIRDAKQSHEKLEKMVKRPDGIPMRRKIPFHELVSSAKEFLEKREREKKKAKEAILTDFNALEEALPTLEQLIEKKSYDGAKPRAAKRLSKQDAEMMEDIQTYQQVLNNPEYVADPIGTITAQLRQRIESGSL